jgi:hypothetical protein
MSYLQDDAELSPSAIFQARIDHSKSISPDSNISMVVDNQADLSEGARIKQAKL